MKALNEIAIWMLAASILIGYFNNELTNGALIFRVFLIVANIVCCAVWDER